MRHICLQSKQGLFNWEWQIYKHSMNRVDIIGSWRQSGPQWLSPILSKGIIPPTPIPSNKKRINKKKINEKNTKPCSFFFRQRWTNYRTVRVSQKLLAGPWRPQQSFRPVFRVQFQQEAFQTSTPSLTSRKKKTKKNNWTNWTNKQTKKRSGWVTEKLVVDRTSSGDEVYGCKSGRVPAVLPPSSRGRRKQRCFF